MPKIVHPANSQLWHASVITVWLCADTAQPIEDVFGQLFLFSPCHAFLIFKAKQNKCQETETLNTTWIWFLSCMPLWKFSTTQNVRRKFQNFLSKVNTEPLVSETLADGFQKSRIGFLFSSGWKSSVLETLIVHGLGNKEKEKNS